MYSECMSYKYDYILYVIFKYHYICTYVYSKLWNVFISQTNVNRKPKTDQFRHLGFVPWLETPTMVKLCCQVNHYKF